VRYRLERHPTPTEYLSRFALGRDNYFPRITAIYLKQKKMINGLLYTYNFNINLLIQLLIKY
jgi:hypothetical protein